jgi:hypothetical protein
VVQSETRIPLPAMMDFIVPSVKTLLRVSDGHLLPLRVVPPFLVTSRLTRQADAVASKHSTDLFGGPARSTAIT